MKKALSLLLALAMVLGLCAGASAESVSEALAAAATMTDEDLYARAQEEIAGGAELDFYSTTSFAEKAAANFEAAYPALAGKIHYHEIDDGESYSILTRSIGTGLNDMGLLQNGSDLRTRLLDPGLAFSYFPESMADAVPEAYRDPAVVVFINSLFIYNNGTTANGEASSINFTNVWELTEDAWKDRIFFKNPTVETVNINFLMMLTSPEWDAKLAAAYESRYGKAWEAGEYESASQEWIAGFLGNVNYTYTSASKIATGIASGNPGNMGLFVFSKLRKVEEPDLSNLAVVQFENDVDCFSGFMYSIYASVFSDTDCPYTCALFINYLLSKDGFASEKCWNAYQGYYSPNTTIEKPEGVEDQPFTYWQDKLVIEDPDYILEHFNEVYEFIALEVG